MFSDIQSILPKALKKSGLGSKMDEVQVIDYFNEIADLVIPGDLRASIRPMYLNSRILTVASLSEYATSILRQKETEIVKFINGKMSEQIVRKLNYLT